MIQWATPKLKVTSLRFLKPYLIFNLLNEKKLRRRFKENEHSIRTCSPELKLEKNCGKNKVPKLSEILMEVTLHPIPMKNRD